MLGKHFQGSAPLQHPYHLLSAFPIAPLFLCHLCNIAGLCKQLLCCTPGTLGTAQAAPVAGAHMAREGVCHPLA